MALLKFLLISFIILNSISFGDRTFALESLKEDFLYKVKYNGINVGEIRLKYLDTDVIELNSNVNILKLFQIVSKEKIYVDKKTYLPLRVERDIKFFGRKERILEEYDQKEGFIKIIKKTKDKTTERLIKQDKPIQNVISLFFFYPKELDNKIGKTLDFNLPLRKIGIRVKELRRIESKKGIEEFYLLEGVPQRFLIWIRKRENLPQKIELPAFLGKIVIALD